MTWGEFFRSSDEELVHFMAYFTQKMLVINGVYGELEDEFEKKLLAFFKEEQEKNDVD